MKIDVYNQLGEKVKETELNKNIFEVKINEGLIHESLIRQMANKRLVIAHTKTRGEVRGGGRKPFKQKGTGRARQGTIRAPHFRGGGIVFGPTKERNFTKRMPKKQRRKALLAILSDKARNKLIMALDKYETEKPKTKELVGLIGKLNIKRSALIVLDEKNMILQKSSQNLQNIKTILINYLNPDDLLNYDQILFLEPALKKAEELFL